MTIIIKQRQKGKSYHNLVRESARKKRECLAKEEETWESSPYQSFSNKSRRIDRQGSHPFGHQTAVWRVGHAHHQQVVAVEEKTPEGAMVAPRIEVPNFEALRHVQPGAKVPRTGLLDEQYVGGVQ